MKEYVGMLMGGPHDGMVVEASVPRILAVSTVELYLDGEDPNKTVNIEVSKGTYTWEPVAKLFHYFQESVSWYKKKPDLDNE